MIILLLSSAFAQDSFDAHGFRLGAFNDDPISPLEGVLPASWERNAFAISGVFEYANAPLVRVDTSGDVVPLLDNVIALNLGGSWSPLPRWRLNVSAPVYFASLGETGPNGLDVGDVRLGTDAVILDGTFSLGVAPFVDLPTGAAEHQLGQGALAGGGLVGARLKFGRSAVGLNVGPYFRPDIALGNLLGSDRLLASVHLGVGVTETLGLNLESRVEYPFLANKVAGTDTPIELLAYGHNRFASGGHVVLGGAMAVSPGASAAQFRLFLGGGFGTYIQAAPKDTDGDGLMDPDDTCPTEAETVNQYLDTDGCPDQLGALALEVRLDGKRVVNAPTSVTGTKPVEVMSALDPILMSDLMPGDVYQASATSGPCLAGTGSATVPAGSTGPLVVDLVSKRSAVVRLEIYDANDKPLRSGIVTWERETTSCVPGQPLLLKDTHEGRQSIGVGTHTVFVTVPNYNTYVETVTLVEGDDKLIKVKLAPSKVVVKAEKIEILEKVFFEFDGDKVDPKSGALLDEIAATLRNHPEILEIEVSGHTDSKGNDAYNLDLSQRRTESVRRWLMDKGVAPERLIARGYGETKPIADNKTSAGRAENRRVEFNILKRDETVNTGEIIKTVDEATDAEKQKAGKTQDNRPADSKIDKDD